METFTLELPAMYGDHHVTEVRRLLLAMPGVQDVYASSCFQVVKITYDPKQTTTDAITAQLDKAGYLGDLALPAEAAQPAPSVAERVTRHTVDYQQTGRVVGFAQNTPYTGRPLWPCPGIGPVQELEE
jgi:copper chaperone CopZ